MGSQWYLLTVLVSFDVALILSVFFAGVSVLETLGLVRDLQRAVASAGSLVAAIFLINLLADLDALPPAPWESIVTWAWLGVGVSYFICLHLLPSVKHGFGPTLLVRARVGPFRFPQQLVQQAVATVEQEMERSQASSAHARREMARRQVFPSRTTKAGVNRETPPSPRVWVDASTSSDATSSSPHPTVSSISSSVSSIHGISNVISILSSLVTLPLEQILATEKHRAIFKAFARGIQREHFVDFLLLLTPYLPGKTEAPCNETSSLHSPSLPLYSSSFSRASSGQAPIAHEALLQLYETYMQEDATFVVPLTAPLRQAFRNLLGVDFRRSWVKLRRSSLSSVSGEANESGRPSRPSDLRTEVELLQAAYCEVAEAVEREVVATLRWVTSQHEAMTNTSKGGLGGGWGGHLEAQISVDRSPRERGLSNGPSAGDPARSRDEEIRVDTV